MNVWLLFCRGITVYPIFRCGLTLMLSTNLVVWMAAVTEESLHQTEIPDLNVGVLHKMYRGTGAFFSLSQCLL